MATENYGFLTIDSGQLNWDTDLNVTIGDIDALFHLRMLPVVGKLDLFNRTSTSWLGQFPIELIDNNLYGMPIFEPTLNLVPTALDFSSWTKTAGVTIEPFDLIMNSKKAVLAGTADYLDVNITTGGTGTTPVNVTFSYFGDCTIDIMQGTVKVDSITASPTTVSLTPATTYTLHITGNWIAHLQAEMLDHATAFSTAEVSRAGGSTNITWDLFKPSYGCFSYVFYYYSGKSSEWGRLFYSDTCEVFLNDVQDTIYLQIGTVTTNSAISITKGLHLFSVNITPAGVEVYLDQNKILSMSTPVAVSKVGFYNGAPNIYVCGCFWNNQNDVLKATAFHNPILARQPSFVVDLPASIHVSTTGIKWTSKYRFKVDPYSIYDLKLRATWTNTTTDAIIKIAIKDVNSGNDIVSISGNTATDFESWNFNKFDISQDGLLEIYAEVVTATANTAGGTADIAYITFEPIYLVR